MKKQALFWMAAALCGTLALASCSTEADEPVVVAPAAKQVSITLTLPGGADTRTTYTEKTGSGGTFDGLKASWAKGDKITIVVAGKFANCVTLTQTGELAEDATTATFTGDISALGEINESTSLLLFYPEITDEGTKCLDYRNQDGTLENLGKYDFLVDYSVKYKEGKLVPSTIGFERRSAFIRLPKDTPVGGNGNISIELYGNANKIYSTNAPAGETIYSVAGGENNILVNTTATNGKLDNDVYIAFAGVDGGIDKVYLKTVGIIYEITVADNFKLGKMYTVTDLSKYKTVTPEVGMVIGSDGNYYATKAAAEASGTNAEAMIAYLGTEAEGATHGLAIALEDVKDADATDYTAYSWYDAATAVNTWADSHKINGDASGWRLPSVYDWQRMFIGCGSTSEYVSKIDKDTSIFEFNAKDFRNMLDSAGCGVKTNYNYWTSTEYEINESEAWTYHFATSMYKFVGYISKSSIINVRAVLAF